MTDLNKFPLFRALLPFLCGLLLSYALQWPIMICLLAVAAVVAFPIFVAIRKHAMLKNPVKRSLIAQLVWFAAGMLVFSSNDYRLNQDGVHRFINREAVFFGEILEIKPGIGGKQQLLLETEKVMYSDSVYPCRGKVMLQVSDDRKLFRCGDLIFTGGKPDPVIAAGNPGEFDAVSFYRTRKVNGILFTNTDAIEKSGSRTSLNSMLTAWRNYLAALMEQHLEGTFLGISKALILGDKSDLDAETMNVFSTTGSMHVLAVSGLHIGLILMLLQRVLQLFGRWITKRQGILLAIVLIWIYGGITGASPAVMRAVVMFSILSGAQLFQRQSNSLNVLGLSAILLLCFDPWMVFDLGFQLSYAAMLGIFLLYRPIVDVWAPRQKIIRMGWEGTAVGFAATVLTTPLILYWFYQFPNYFALANIGVMVFGFAVLMLGLVFLFTVWIPYAVKLVAVIFSFSILGLVLWVEWVDSLPGAVSGGFHLTAWQVVIAYVLVSGWIFHLQFRKIRRLWLTTATIGLIAWWSFERAVVLNSRECIFFNSNQFIAAVKIGDEVYGCYDHKWNGSWKEPRELQAYARYTGSRLHILQLVHDETTLFIGKEKWQFTREKEGFSIHRGKKKWFYRTDGIPNAKDRHGLMTTRLQLHADPNAKPGPYILKF